MTFAQAQGLARHMSRKFPCIERGGAPAATHAACNRCTQCGQVYSTAGNLERHKRKVCARKQIATADAAAPIAVDSFVEMQTRIAALERMIEGQQQQPGANYAIGTSGIAANSSMIVNNIGGTVSNVVNVNNVTIAPWGSPLQLTDADVEAVLATVPGLAGTPALPEVVAALMELVKRAHMAPTARNIHLNPKRTDQALALMPGGWAAMPLEEATAALFDGASASMAAARAPSVRQTVRMSIPVQYRAERAASVQLGLRPMGAHLLNVAPGGPGPLLLTGPAAPAGTAAGMGAGGQQPAETARDTIDAIRARELIKNHPATAGVTTEWLARVTAAAGVSAMGLARALRQASTTGLCGMAEWQGILRLQSDSCQALACGDP